MLMSTFNSLEASSGGEVPNSDGLVVGSGEEVFAVGVEDEGSDPIAVASLDVGKGGDKTIEEQEGNRERTHKVSEPLPA